MTGFYMRYNTGQKGVKNNLDTTLSRYIKTTIE